MLVTSFLHCKQHYPSGSGTFREGIFGHTWFGDLPQLLKLFVELITFRRKIEANRLSHENRGIYLFCFYEEGTRPRWIHDQKKKCNLQCNNNNNPSQSAGWPMGCSEYFSKLSHHSCPGLCCNKVFSKRNLNVKHYWKRNLGSVIMQYLNLLNAVPNSVCKT